MAQNRVKIAAIIQVRMSSTRLPGKSLSDIAGQSLLAHIIDRVRASKRINLVVIATTIGREDDVLEALARAKGVELYRGSPNDVLDRYYQAATQFRCDIVVRITADDPFKDPLVIDQIIDRLQAGPVADYASNTLEPTYPEGLDVEVFTYHALSRAWAEAAQPSEREHVTPYIWKNTRLFKVISVTQTPDHSHLRWTLDYPEDLEFTRAVYAHLYRGNIFSTQQILDLLQQEPALANINKQFIRNAGYLKSVQDETRKSSL